MDGTRGALVSLVATFRLRGAKAREGWSVRSRKYSHAALLREEKGSLECLITKNWPEMSLERAGQIIHHVQWQHLFSKLLLESLNGYTGKIKFFPILNEKG